MQATINQFSRNLISLKWQHLIFVCVCPVLFNHNLCKKKQTNGFLTLDMSEPTEKERVIPNFLNINGTEAGKWHDYVFSFAPILSMYFFSICLGLTVAIFKRNEPASKFKQPFMQILGLIFSCIGFVGFCVR